MAKSKRKKKKPRVPEVLWRIFSDKARTLSDRLISLIPPNHSRRLCSCIPASPCLACCDDPPSFLIRPGDPKPYRTLMTHCFVVVPDAAPPLHSWIPTCFLPQLQLVTRTIEVMLTEGSGVSNVLCNGYDKVTSSSPIVELLTSPAWVTLLKRVGDIVMHYLLRHTSVFLPLHHNSHFQVSGKSIGNLNLKIIQGTRRRLPDQDQVLLHCGARSCKKRKLSDYTDSSVERQSKSYGEHLPLPISREGSQPSEVCTDENSKQHSSGGVIESRKRTRQHRWRRIKKLRQSNLMEVAYNNSEARSESRRAPIQSCCSFLFQAPMKITDRTLIDRHPMFHRADRSPSLLPKHRILDSDILNTLKPSYSGANQLIGEIFGGSFRPDKCDQRHDSHTCSVDSACLHLSLVKKMKALIRRACNCKYRKLLNKHCPIQTLNSTTTKRTDSAIEIAESLELGENVDPHQSGGPVPFNEQLNLCQLYCSKHQVASFIWALCRSIIPQELLGTSSNWRSMRRNISLFMGLRRFEKFSLRQCMHKLKITAFCFFSNETTSRHMVDQTSRRMKGMKGIQVKVSNSGYEMRVRLLHCWVYWLLTKLIIPVVQCNFYVTTTKQGNQDIFYFRKPVWEKLIERTVSDLKDQTLLHVNVELVRDIIGSRNFGFSRLRFLPKANGMRAIANLSARSLIPKQVRFQNQHFTGRQKVGPYTKKLRSVNYVLRDLHVVLKGLRCSEPEKLGSSVFDYNDVYQRLCPFLISLKESGIMPSAYIVVADVEKAFDTINQEKLLLVMNNVIEQDLYHLKKMPQVICTKNSMWTHENILLKNQTISLCPSASRPSVPYKLLHTVLVNQESSYALQNEYLCRCLAAHVKGNVLYLDGKFYLQKNGIAQGSILSSLLCSFYFAHLEENVIYPFLEKAYNTNNHCTLVPCNDGSAQLGSGKTGLPHPKYLLMRFIDDIILITTSRKQASSYCARLQRGFRDYNSYINSEKWGLNFKCDNIPDVSDCRLLAGDDGQSFLPWSGLLINCQTLEIQADYGRYLKNHLCSTLTINWHNKPYRHLEQKLQDFMCPKCHPILFDQNINSETVARVNVYQIFLLAAMKFHCYMQGLSRFSKPQPNFSSPVLNSIRYLYTLIKKHMRQISIGSSIRPILTLNKKEVEWLGLAAFIRALKRKQCRHKKLMSILKSKLKAHPLSENVPLLLKNAVDDSHSSVFWKIKY